MTEQQLNEIREMVKRNPLTGQRVEGKIATPLFSGGMTASTLGLNFDIDEAIKNDSKLFSVFQKAYAKYSTMKVK